MESESENLSGGGERKRGLIIPLHLNLKYLNPINHFLGVKVVSVEWRESEKESESAQKTLCLHSGQWRKKALLALSLISKCTQYSIQRIADGR